VRNLGWGLWVVWDRKMVVRRIVRRVEGRSVFIVVDDDIAGFDIDSDGTAASDDDPLRIILLFTILSNIVDIEYSIFNIQ